MLSGIFLSHSSEDNALLKELEEYLAKSNISYLSDSMISAGENYIEKIKELINSASGGVVLLSNNTMLSNWVMYEIGLLEGLEKDILLFSNDPGSLAKKKLPPFLQKYPIIFEYEELVEKIVKYSIFGNIFEHETATLKKSDFKSALSSQVKSQQLTIPLKNQGAFDFSKIRFGYIVIRLARAGDFNINYRRCPVTHETREGLRCSYENKEINCVLLDDIRCEDALETVALNSVLYYAKLNEGSIEYHIPCHEKYGVTFKCFADVKDVSLKAKLESILEYSGIPKENISSSESGENQRIYFLLDEAPDQSLFHIVSPEGIKNNFYCPGVINE